MRNIDNCVRNIAPNLMLFSSMEMSKVIPINHSINAGHTLHNIREHDKYGRLYINTTILTKRIQSAVENKGKFRSVVEIFRKWHYIHSCMF